MNLRKIKQLETEVQVLQDVLNIPKDFGVILTATQEFAIKDIIIEKQYELHKQKKQD